ncbi:unnamed protein product [Pleuronectes platessa]|uniref:Uncharacterized protein n=1 Tax=Pleuronectes platessa TaxID=8262 RepID=A0A9N7VY38_PLEPL|nr:unnamed protein product [Pleuronectes platessa]
MRGARKALRGAAERPGEGVPRWRRRSYLSVSVKTEKHTLALKEADSKLRLGWDMDQTTKVSYESLHCLTATNGTIQKHGNHTISMQTCPGRMGRAPIQHLTKQMKPLLASGNPQINW